MDPARDLQHEISCLLSKLGLGQIPWDWLCSQQGRLVTDVWVLCVHVVFMELLFCSNTSM